MLLKVHKGHWGKASVCRFPIKKKKKEKEKTSDRTGCLKIVIVVKSHFSIKKMTMSQCLQVVISSLEVFTDISGIADCIKTTYK